MEEIHVGCPCCNNKWLFDVNIHTKRCIKIKCPICKSAAITLKNMKVHTEPIGV